MSPLLHATLFTLVPVSATIVGGALATIRRPGPALASFVQHAAAGIVFAAVAVEVIPEVRRQSEIVAIVGFALGIGAMLTLGAVSRRLEQGAPQTGDSRRRSNAVLGAQAGLIAATAIDVLIDGLVLGAGFAAGARQGALLAVALTMELLFLGLSTAGALLTGGASRAVTIAITSAIAVLPMVGAVVGVVLLRGASPGVVATMLAFGAVALMYLVTEELLTEAHEVPETPWATGVFFVGFLAYLLIAEAFG